MKCPNCSISIEHNITDLDIPPALRTEANYWKAEYFKMAQEVRKANKGLMRLKRKGR